MCAVEVALHHYLAAVFYLDHLWLSDASTTVRHRILGSILWLDKVLWSFSTRDLLVAATDSWPVDGNRLAPIACMWLKIKHNKNQNDGVWLGTPLNRHDVMLFCIYVILLRFLGALQFSLHHKLLLFFCIINSLAVRCTCNNRLDNNTVFWTEFKYILLFSLFDIDT